MNKQSDELGCYEPLIEALATQGYAVVPQFITAEQVQQLANRATELQQLGLLQPANTGKNRLNANLRGDATFWLDENSTHPTERAYLALTDNLQLAINRSLFLGLHALESHFAVYPAGAFYKKHLDQFSGDHANTQQAKQGDVRQVSCILYLNNAWQASDGGELRIYLDENDTTKTLDVRPEGGTLVLFLSSRFYHEVLPAKRPRMSLTGWFKTRGNSVF
ncbi:MAG TPA: 2OG-Fe(II) oxygenase [Methylotenera sp.]|nr:2OG-Fe(II) oxygenase [Methylotenera sp.]HPH06503.1 2OG-Fe(II) oxygenase [Methylotenera sp.]HPN01264.1 2OG-Fe(II) oxygenase [Methylotenera sp.]